MERLFLLTPLREGRHIIGVKNELKIPFLLTPLREGRRVRTASGGRRRPISTHAPAGGATTITFEFSAPVSFLLTPLREGRLVRSEPR